MDARMTPFDNTPTFIKPTKPPTPGKPELIRYRKCVELGNEPFTGILAHGKFPDGRVFALLIPSTREMVEDADLDHEEIARRYVETTTPEMIDNNRRDWEDAAKELGE